MAGLSVPMGVFIPSMVIGASRFERRDWTVFDERNRGLRSCDRKLNPASGCWICMYVHMCQGLNSHYFHIIGDGHQPNSRGLYTHYKDSY